MLYTFTLALGPGDVGNVWGNVWDDRPHRRLRQAGLDRADGARLHRVLAHRPGDPGLHHMERTDGNGEWTDGMWMAWRPWRRHRGVAPARHRAGQPHGRALGAPADAPR